MKFTKELIWLRNFYFATFGIGVMLVVLMHSFDRPMLDIFRVPTFIGLTSEYNGLEYFATFRIYQISLVTSLVAVLIDGLCLTNYRSKFLIKVSEISTIVGLSVLILALFFFSYNFLLVNHTLRDTAAVYIAFSTFLIIVDLINFKVDERLLSKGTR